ncbi:hypothetical protein [Burkholderia multivorans]|uniref:hypothetical protein n=1 Tax=Burkholderia multivorans TaxID=87883 RepID=UPI0009BE009C|nr:hypothetical protein [Burkholderia multivorans]
MSHTHPVSSRAFASIDVRESAIRSHDTLPPSLQSGTRNADPSVWPVLDSVGALFDANRHRLEQEADDVGMICFGNAFPKATSQRIISDIARAGRVSPTAFINANAGAALSICCTRFGFRGPTLNLTMHEDRARYIVDAIASSWLEGGSARYLILVNTRFDPASGISATSTLTARHAHS